MRSAKAKGQRHIAYILVILLFTFWWWFPPLVVSTLCAVGVFAFIKLYKWYKKDKIRRQEEYNEWMEEYKEQYWNWFYAQYGNPMEEMAEWQQLTEEELEIDSVREFVPMAQGTELAIMEYVYEPDLKAVCRILTDGGLSPKSWKKTVRHVNTVDKGTAEKIEYNYILLNGKEYRLYSVPKG